MVKAEPQPVNTGECWIDLTDPEYVFKDQNVDGIQPLPSIDYNGAASWRVETDPFG